MNQEEETMGINVQSSGPPQAPPPPALGIEAQLLQSCLANWGWHTSPDHFCQLWNRALVLGLPETAEVHRLDKEVEKLRNRNYPSKPERDNWLRQMKADAEALVAQCPTDEEVTRATVH